MKRTKSFGFIDPITLGFLIALAGSAVAVTAEKADQPVAVAAAAPVAQGPGAVAPAAQ